jgi:hypothetical protein
MMRIAITLIYLLFSTVPASAEPLVPRRMVLSLDSYQCKEFLKDIANPSDSQKFVRSLMMISWATGFVAAYDKANPRADERALTLVGAALKSACIANPEKMAPEAMAQTLTKVISR